MKTVKPTTDTAGEVRELTAEDFSQFRPASEVLDPALYAGLVAMKKGGRPKSASPKVLVTVRYSAEVLEWFKSKGDGWQTRMDEVLKAYVTQQRAA
jgi:uncharacterized protein (DUF4415 family)